MVFSSCLRLLWNIVAVLLCCNRSVAISFIQVAEMKSFNKHHVGIIIVATEGNHQLERLDSVVGLTIVAFGTSSPELVVSLTAAIKESQGLALGNIIGSNIANVGLVLGLAAMFAPLKVGVSLLRRELPIMIGVSLLFFAMTLDLVISFWDGLVLVLGLFAYTGYHLYGALKESKAGISE